MAISKKSKQLLESLYGHADEGILLRTFDNSVIYMNAKWYAYVEKNQDCQAWLNKQTEECLQSTGNAVRHVIRDVDQGRENFFEIIARRIILPQNDDAVLFSLRDVTKQEKTLQTLYSCQANLTGLVNNPADYIWTIDKKYCMTLINKRFLSVYRAQYQVDIVPGDSALEIVHPHLSGQQWRQLYKRALEGERIVETHSVMEDGECKCFDVFLHPIYEDEDITGAAVFLRDVTTQRQSEKRVYRLRQICDLIIETTHVLIAAQDIDGRVILWNKGAEDISGYMRDEVIGRREVGKLMFPDPSYRNSVMRQIQSVGQGEERENIYLKVQTRYRGVRTLTVNSREILDEKGGLEGIYHIAFDVTEEQQQAKFLKKQADTDSLTGILNRRAGMMALECLLQEQINSEGCLCIVYADVNRLKYINDTYGHQEGDSVIILVANTLKEIIRQTDIVCRLGGDEFLFVFARTRRDDAQRIVEKIEKKLQENSQLEAKDYLVSISTGIWEHDTSAQFLCAEELLELADQEMYKHKLAWQTAHGYDKSGCII